MSFESETGRDKYFRQLEIELAELVDPATGLLRAEVAREVDCPLCGGGRRQTVFVKRGYAFARCGDCGLVFANPQVIPEVVEKTYRHAKSSTELWMEVLRGEKETAWRRGYYESVLDGLERRTGKGDLLDVGCAVGQFMTIARARGWRTTGLEISETAVKHCHGLGLDVRRQTLEEADLPAGGFDAVTLLGVLEHVPDPVNVLRGCSRVLRPGGTLCAIVPNVYSFANLFLREKNVTFDGRNHLVYFCEDTLKLCCEKTGLDVVACDSVLTGLDNVIRYAQFFDPYGEERGTRYLPRAARALAEEPGRRAELEKWITDSGLGLRLRVFAARRGG